MSVWHPIIHLDSASYSAAVFAAVGPTCTSPVEACWPSKTSSEDLNFEASYGL